MSVLDTREEMMLDLIVQAAVHEAKKRAPDIAGSGNLLAQEGLVDIMVFLIVIQYGPIEIVRYNKEECQIITSNNEHRDNIQQSA